MMIEGQRARSTAGQERRHEKERDGKMGGGGMANERGEASSRGLDCPGERVLNILGGIWSTSASLSIHSPHPPITPVHTRPHPFTDCTSITPDNT